MTDENEKPVEKKPAKAKDKTKTLALAIDESDAKAIAATPDGDAALVAIPASVKVVRLSPAFEPLTVPQIDQGLNALDADALAFHRARLRRMADLLSVGLHDATETSGRRGDWKSYEIITACIGRIEQRQTQNA